MMEKVENQGATFATSCPDWAKVMPASGERSEEAFSHRPILLAFHRAG